ncbi:hypothetical protein GCM10017783_07040 [Deinococcus piscis]|uniref:Uncharacterized protein n=2 Tax=Deinococcus piscis TaxID=394230 RepID=A0ABQ3K040_9DEIO|nr:hypothetical protein GCM10017783_07040 [Deinococcus piscis]
MPARLGAQALTSPLLEWTGPQLFGYSIADIGVNAGGDLFLGQSAFGMYWDDANRTLPPHLLKFTSTGQKLALQRFPFGTQGGSNAVLVTEDGAKEEVYHLIDPREPYSEGPQAEIYGTDMQRLSNGSEEQFSLPIQGFPSEVVPAKQGIATLQILRPEQGGAGGVDVRELAYRSWGEIGLTQHYVLRSPAALKDGTVRAHLASASDGSLYLLTSVDIPNEECHSFRSHYFSTLACPSVMGVTKFVDGEAAWQVYWESSSPQLALDLSASVQGVSILMTSGHARGEPSATSAQTVLSFGPDGSVKGNITLPIQQLRSQLEIPDKPGLADTERVVSAPLNLTQDNEGHLLAYSDNLILTGTVMDGFVHHYLMDSNGVETAVPLPAERGSINKVVMRGEYVYAIGTTNNKFGSPQPPLLNSPDDLNRSTVQEKTFLLPLDFQLRSRSGRS